MLHCLRTQYYSYSPLLIRKLFTLTRQEQKNCTICSICLVEVFLKQKGLERKGHPALQTPADYTTVDRWGQDGIICELETAVNAVCSVHVVWVEPDGYMCVLGRQLDMCSECLAFNLSFCLFTLITHIELVVVQGKMGQLISLQCCLTGFYQPNVFVSTSEIPVCILFLQFVFRFQLILVVNWSNSNPAYITFITKA